MSLTRKTQILVVDEHAVFRDALGLILAGERDFQIAGECGSVLEALKILAARPIDLVVLDLRVSGARGSAFFPLIRELGFRGKVFVVTAKVQTQVIVQLLAAGASGILLERSGAELLVPAIRQVLDGQIWIDPNLVPEGSPFAGSRSPAQLTDRERKVVIGVVEGLTNKEIAARLGTSEESIKSSVQRLFSKLRVRSRVQIAVKMMEHVSRSDLH